VTGGHTPLHSTTATPGGLDTNDWLACSNAFWATRTLTHQVTMSCSVPTVVVHVSVTDGLWRCGTATGCQAPLVRHACYVVQRIAACVHSKHSSLHGSTDTQQHFLI
jgi:hypothetical protein